MNIEKQNDNRWSVFGYGFMYAMPWIVMLIGSIVHYQSTNEGIVDLGFIIIMIAFCAGITNARCDALETKISELEQTKLNNNENKD